MIRFYTILTCLLFSCGIRIDYMGNAYPPTKSLDVFVDPANIKKPYSVIGRGYTFFAVGESGRMDKVQEKAIKKGLEKGADAVLFQDQVVADNDLSVSTTIHTTTTGHKGMRTTTGTTTPVITSRVDIYYLKYEK